jgi:hypothetical protein
MVSSFFKTLAVPSSKKEHGNGNNSKKNKNIGILWIYGPQRDDFVNRRYCHYQV